ncbi:UDP-galactopyranose mutase [Selenomonas ruminantium]|uniref:UDP-galactopyranose mutase n=1 Tax=Selenomonas ruminantium TaxID=971 RepID=UPI0004007EE8
MEWQGFIVGLQNIIATIEYILLDRLSLMGEDYIMKYDYLIVGSGLFGAVFAHEMSQRGKKCLVLERRQAVGGNIRCEEREGINVHVYGAHIFHTNNQMVWTYLNRFVQFNQYINSPMANFRGELYNLPFNMNTFRAMWGVRTPAEAKMKISAQRTEIAGEPLNLEEQAISLVGRDIYEKLIQGYTEKQWGRKCKDLPAFIIKRLPVRYTYDNNYFNARYQGIPIGGYNKIIEKLLEGIQVQLGVDYNTVRSEYDCMAEKVMYTGSLDEYFGYRLGRLAYRGLRFEMERLEQENYQGVAVMNYTAPEVPYTRIIEHKHFEFGTQPVTYITREYPQEWQPGQEAYYPVNDQRNQDLYNRYAGLAGWEEKLLLGGRLALYRYLDMDKVVELALAAVERELGS